MKTAIGILALAGGLVSSLAFSEHASPQVIEAAQSVKVQLTELAEISLNAGDRAAVNDNYQRERILDDISETSQELSSMVHKRVIRELKKGERKQSILRSLQRMDRDFSDLEQNVNDLRGPLIKDAHVQVEMSLQRLKRALSRSGGGGGGPYPGPPQGNIRASCQGKFGGNFFNKKTHVECSFIGLGAVSYEVQFYNQQTGQRATVSELLNPRQQRQQVSTDKVFVGRSAEFTVIVNMRSGDQRVVASGVATGNPF